MRAAGTFSNGRVTVVLPTYNRAALFPRALETVFRQTALARCDILLLDDGSTDDTPAAAARYRGRIEYLRQENAGLAAARNAAIRACPNEFVALLDDDDLWEPDKIERQLAALEQWPDVVMVAGRAVNQFADGRRHLRPIPSIPLNRPADLAPLLFETNFLPPSTVMLRTRTLFEVGLFHPQLRRAEDQHLWIRMACRGPCVVLNELVAAYAMDTPSALSGNASRQILAQIRAYYLVQDALRERPDCRPHWQRGLGRALTDLRDVAYRQQHYVTAARYGLRSLLQQPWNRPRWEWTRLVESIFRATVGPAASTSHARRDR